jgi:Lrp/AsnC family transcriptional regulator for asnA, asnC and gidA
LSSARLDELDHEIVTALGKDARVSNRQIAAELDVTEGTIRTRIKRLQNEGLIRFTVVTDFKLVGSPNLVMLGIHAEIGRVPALAKMLAAMPELGCVMVLLGRYNLLAMGLFTSMEQVNALIRRQIRTLSGVRSVEISTSIRNFKYDARVARITPEKKHSEG